MDESSESWKSRDLNMLAAINPSQHYILYYVQVKTNSEHLILINYLYFVNL